MKFINFKISHEYIFPLDNIAYVPLYKIFTISVQTFEILDFIRFQSPGNLFLLSTDQPLVKVDIKVGTRTVPSL